MLRAGLFLCLAALATAQEMGRETGVPLLVRVPTPPIPVPSDGKYLLVYELHLTADQDPVEVTKVEVLGDKPLAVLDAATLAKSIRHSAAPGRADTRISAGNHAVVWVMLTLDARPKFICHRISARVGSDAQEVVLQAARCTLRGEPLKIAPPLRGDRWVSFNGLSNDSHHRRGWFATGDRAIVPQRYAIDFARVDSNGQLLNGDPKVNRNHACYGAEVLAVADATVFDATDGIPETQGDPGAIPWTLKNIAGNSVVLDLGRGRYALYAHLQPGSVRVKRGDRVRTGQVVGLVGNSGNSTGPHLHFHIADGPSLTTGDGLPFVFDFHRGDKLHRQETPRAEWLLRFR